MKKKGFKILLAGIIFTLGFIIWTGIIQVVDVIDQGINGTTIGLSHLNIWFHNLTGVNMKLYTVTDWLGLVPIGMCMIFASLGAFQLLSRKSLLKVDLDIIVLGIYFIVVIIGYLVFEMIPINYRPVLIEGRMEASYPSSTTLLVISVMMSVSLQINKRIKSTASKVILNAIVISFSLFMVIGRTVSGVHWITDIIGSILFSSGLFLMYKSIVVFITKNK